VRSGAGCVDPDFDEYLDGLVARSLPPSVEALPDTR
jgi:hypothetical protein